MHTFPRLFQNLPVTVHLIDHPWHDHSHITPCRGTVLSQNIGHYVRHTFFQGGLRGHITHPLSEKQCRIPVKCRRPRKDLRIPCPAKTLVTLRAVRGNIKKISPLPPRDIALELVHLPVGTAEVPDFLHIGMHHTRGELIQ